MVLFFVKWRVTCFLAASGYQLHQLIGSNRTKNRQHTCLSPIGHLPIPKQAFYKLSYGDGGYKSQQSEYNIRFVIWTSRVKTPASRSAFTTESVRGFSHSLQSNFGTSYQIRPRSLYHTFLETHYILITLPFDIAQSSY